MHRLEIETPSGIAAVHVATAPDALGTLVLGHGAGGGVWAPDLTAVAQASQEAVFQVVLVEQPYRVAGRRAPPRAQTLDEAWIAVVARLRKDVAPQDRLLVVGGRSSGARVACRTAERTGAAGVLCLAFPLQPAPRGGRPPAPSRLPELDAVTVPVLVVQGERDPFGSPPGAPGRSVVTVAGDHSLRHDQQRVADAACTWLLDLAGASGAPQVRTGGRRGADGHPGGRCSV